MLAEYFLCRFAFLIAAVVVAQSTRCCSTCYTANDFYINECDSCKSAVYAIVGDNVTFNCSSCDSNTTNATWIVGLANDVTQPAVVDGVSKPLNFLNVTANQTGLIRCQGDDIKLASKKLIVCDVPALSNVVCNVSYNLNDVYKGYYVYCSWPLRSEVNSNRCTYRAKGTVSARNNSSGVSKLLCTFNCSTTLCSCKTPGTAYWDDIYYQHFELNGQVEVTFDGDGNTTRLIAPEPLVYKEPINRFYKPAANFQLKRKTSNSLTFEVPSLLFPYGGINLKRECQVEVYSLEEHQIVSRSTVEFGDLNPRTTEIGAERHVVVANLRPFHSYRVSLRYRHVGVGDWSDWVNQTVSTMGSDPIFPPDFRAVLLFTSPSTRANLHVFTTAISKEYRNGPAITTKLLTEKGEELASSTTSKLQVNLSDPRIRWQRGIVNENHLDTSLFLAIVNEFGQNRRSLTVTYPNRLAPKSVCLNDDQNGEMQIQWEKPADSYNVGHVELCECQSETWSTCETDLTCRNVSGTPKLSYPLVPTVYGVAACYDPNNYCYMRDSIDKCPQHSLSTTVTILIVASLLFVVAIGLACATFFLFRRRCAKCCRHGIKSRCAEPIYEEEPDYRPRHLEADTYTYPEMIRESEDESDSGETPYVRPHYLDGLRSDVSAVLLRTDQTGTTAG